jgi:hypothetical protein
MKTVCDRLSPLVAFNAPVRLIEDQAINVFHKVPEAKFIDSAPFRHLARSAVFDAQRFITRDRKYMVDR